MKFVVVAVGYNRPNSMMQLLETVCSADYEENEVDLIISVDKGERQEEVVRAAKKFDWKHGKKYVYEHKERQGLRKHILLCGDFTEKYDMVLSSHWEALMVQPSPTVQSVSITWGPMQQFSPMTVFPRRIVPGSSIVPAPTVTSSST